MMWTEDGVAAIDYPHSFHPELAPAHLSYALALAGFRPPVAPGQPFRYAELGCGQGLTSNMLAAIHPEGAFEAMDALPSHMEQATRLAHAAGLDNVRHAAETFADFAARPGGEDLDFIVLHGVWSWVAPEHRVQLADIARRRLKPGGCLYVSYNCLPGWAADMPVRQLLLEAVEAAEGSLPERIAAALDRLDRLAAQGGYFDHVPGALKLLRSLRAKSDGYIAHEFLNRHWQPFYHGEVAAQLAPLDFAASATLLDHLPLPDAVSHMATGETWRDALTYARFRRDIFVKAPERLSAADRAAALGRQRFGLVVPRPQVPESASTAMGEVDMDPVIANSLADGPASGLDALELCAIGAAAPLPPADSARVERCARFNAAVLETNRSDPAIRQLASPVLGTGLVVDLLERLFLLAEQDGRDPPAFAWDWLNARGKRLRRDGSWLEGDENLAELRALHASFRSGRRLWLQGQGIGVSPRLRP